MKNKLFIGLFISVLFSIILFTSCNKHDDITSPRDLNFDSQQFAIVDITDVNNAIEDATVDTDMSMNGSLFNYSFMSVSDFKPGNMMTLMNMLGDRNWMSQFDWQKHLGRLLRSLNLMDDQKTQIRGFVQTYHDGMKPLVQQFKDANADIVKAANEKRKAIVDKVKAGELTREQAKILIDLLNRDTRAKIVNNPATVTIKAQMCTLRDNLFSSIRSVLTADQKTKWDDAIGKMPNPCQ